MRKVAMGVLAVGVCFWAGIAGALDLDIKCQAGKNKVAGKYAFCRQKAEATALKKGATPYYTKCDEKFFDKWAKEEEKAGAGVCPDEPLDPNSLADFITEHSDAVAAALAGSALPECGNNAIDAAGEQCDGTDVGGLACTDLGWNAGTLACDGSCLLDYSGCYDYKRVFVTLTSTYTGDLDGLAGADFECNKAADNGLLGGGWTAWLSTSTVDAKDRIPDAEYRLVNGTTVVATSKADLLDGTLSAGINMTEVGSIASTPAWTGTEGSGTKGANTCGDWTNTAAPDSRIGSPSATTGGMWTASAVGVCSAGAFRLYCFER